MRNDIIDDQYIIFMEEANGGDLWNFMKERPNSRFTEIEAKVILYQIV